jgi:hypothetical protein
MKMIISIDVINWHNVNFLLVVDFGITDTQKTIKSSKYEISSISVSDSDALKKRTTKKKNHQQQQLLMDASDPHPSTLPHIGIFLVSLSIQTFISFFSVHTV